MINTIKQFFSVYDFKRKVISITLVIALFSALATIIFLRSVHTVKIFDGDKSYTVRSFKSNVAEVIANLDLDSDKYKVLKTSGKCTTVKIEHSFPVYISVGDKTSVIDFTGGTVEDALKLAGFNPDKNDFVEPSLETKISSTKYIDYTDINYVTGSYTEVIPYETKTVYSDDVKSGTTTFTAGTEGLKEINYTEKTVNGVSESKSITSEKVLKNAVDAVKTVGTKTASVSTMAVSKTEEKVVSSSNNVKCVSTLSPASPIYLDENGNPVNFKSKITARATAYTYTGNNCAVGVAPQPGYIAVNPKVIPYGTKMYIKTANGGFIYGYAVAADTGGFIKKYPTGVDLFMSTESECVSFGVRNVEIYILE